MITPEPMDPPDFQEPDHVIEPPPLIAPSHLTVSPPQTPSKHHSPRVSLSRSSKPRNSKGSVNSAIPVKQLPPLPPPPVYSLADFEIIQPITKGAYGRVLLVRPRKARQLSSNIDSNKLYAMKVLHRSGITESKVQKRLILEYEILETLSQSKSDYIVKLQCSFQTAQNFYLVMEYQPGGDLFSLLAGFGYFDECVAKQYIAEIILAVDFLHQHNVVHCDLKPDNLLIGADGHLRLTDFGLSFNALFTTVESGLMEENSNSDPVEGQNSNPLNRQLTSKDNSKDQKRFATMTFDDMAKDAPTQQRGRMFDFLRQERGASCDCLPTVDSDAQLTRSASPRRRNRAPSPSPPRHHSTLLNTNNKTRNSSKTVSSPKHKLTPLQSKLTAHYENSNEEENESDGDNSEDNNGENNETTVNIKGTPDYIAPEIIEGDEFALTFTVDWWAVGIILVELLTGTTPFNAETREQVYHNILTKDISTILDEILPEEVSDTARSLIVSLLEKDPTKRLGTYDGVSAIQQHPFFVDVDWENLYEVEPPFVPEFDSSTFGMEYFEARDERFPVKAITTEDVSEDINNARKERALKVFDMNSNERKKKLRQYQSKRTPFKVFGNVIFLDPDEFQKDHKSKDQSKQNKFAIPEIPSYSKLRSKKAAEKKRAHQKHSSHHRKKKERASGKSWQEAKPDLVTTQPITVKPKTFTTSLFTNPDSVAVPTARLSRSNTFAFRKQSDDERPKFPSQPPTNMSPSLYTSSLTSPQPSYSIKNHTLSKLAFLNQPAPVPPKRQPTEQALPRSHSFSEKKGSNDVIPDFSALTATKDRTSTTKQAIPKSSNALPLQPNSSSRPNSQKSLNPNIASTTPSSREHVIFQSVGVDQDGNTSTEQVSSDHSSCSCSYSLSDSDMLSIDSDHTSHSTKYHPPSLALRKHDTDGPFHPAFDSLNLSRSMFMQRKELHPDVLPMTFVDTRMSIDFNTPPDFNIPSSLPLISQPGFIHDGEHTPYSMSQETPLSPTSIHSEVNELIASSLIQPDFGSPHHQIVNINTIGRQRSATIAAPNKPIIITSSQQTGKKMERTPERNKEQRKAQQGSTESKHQPLISRKDSQKSSITTNTSPTKHRKHKHKRHKPGCKKFKPSPIHETSKLSISLSHSPVEDEKGTNHSGEFGEFGNHSFGGNEDDAVFFEISALPPPAQQQSFGIVLDEKQENTESASPLFQHVPKKRLKTNKGRLTGVFAADGQGFQSPLSFHPIKTNIPVTVPTSNPLVRPTPQPNTNVPPHTPTHSPTTQLTTFTHPIAPESPSQNGPWSSKRAQLEFQKEKMKLEEIKRKSGSVIASQLNSSTSSNTTPTRSMETTRQTPPLQMEGFVQHDHPLLSPSQSQSQILQNFQKHQSYTPLRTTSPTTPPLAFKTTPPIISDPSPNHPFSSADNLNPLFVQAVDASPSILSSQMLSPNAQPSTNQAPLRSSPFENLAPFPSTNKTHMPLTTTREPTPPNPIPSLGSRPIPSPPAPYLEPLRSSSVVHRPDGERTISITPPSSVTPHTADRDSLTSPSVQRQDDKSPSSRNLFDKFFQKAKEKIRKGSIKGQPPTGITSPHSPHPDLYVSPLSSPSPRSPGQDARLFPALAHPTTIKAPVVSPNWDGTRQGTPDPHSVTPPIALPSFATVHSPQQKHCKQSTLKQTFVDMSLKSSPREASEEDEQNESPLPIFTPPEKQSPVDSTHLVPVDPSSLPISFSSVDLTEMDPSTTTNLLSTDLTSFTLPPPLVLPKKRPVEETAQIPPLHSDTQVYPSPQPKTPFDESTIDTLSFQVPTLLKHTDHDADIPSDTDALVGDQLDTTPLPRSPPPNLSKRRRSVDEYADVLKAFRSVGRTENDLSDVKGDKQETTSDEATDESDTFSDSDFSLIDAETMPIPFATSIPAFTTPLFHSPRTPAFPPSIPAHQSPYYLPFDPKSPAQSPFAPPFNVAPSSPQSHTTQPSSRSLRSKSFLNMSSFLRSHPLSFTSTQPQRAPHTLHSDHKTTQSPPDLPLDSHQP
ncbi:putative serine/threonine protein kinase [Blattamonas nauphoetae]|uniref:non-specific serine/threonine protein kinase n=1 Tax=Blattamonas nauphoetae TaxID=2049346 RepID=A0ABQ9YJZ6_9EUKA|nr:putative serine/threonine protein kinase [Blattamonas nauphoetae]